MGLPISLDENGRQSWAHNEPFKNLWNIVVMLQPEMSVYICNRYYNKLTGLQSIGQVDN